MMLDSASSPQAESYHEEMLEHLYELQRRVTNGINTVLEVQRNGHKYLAAEKNTLVAQVKSSCPDSPCPLANNYLGNPRPPGP